MLGNRLDKDKRARGTVIGAAAGAAAGGGLGYMMDRQEAELRDQLASERAQHAVEVERVRDDLLKLTLANEVSFDVDSATVKPAFRRASAKVAEVLQQLRQPGHDRRPHRLRPAPTATTSSSRSAARGPCATS